MNTLQIISIGHSYTTSAERLAWYLGVEQIANLREGVKGLGCKGMVVLQTCNRLEVFVEADQDVRMRVAALWQSIVGTQALAPGKLKTYIGNTVSMRYILKVATGLESAILGDDQILHQMKKAWEQARQVDGLSTLLERSYQAFMRFHKTICRDTDFKSHSISLAYHTWRQIVSAVHSVHDKKVLIIGAGDMAKQVLKYIPKFRPEQVYIANRTYSSAEALAPEGVIVVPMVDIDTINADVIINCSPVGMLTIAEIKHSPRVIADLALEVDYEIADSITLFTLSQLQHAISQHHQQRMGSLPIVMRLMHGQIAEFTTWTHQWNRRRTIAQQAEMA